MRSVVVVLPWKGSARECAEGGGVCAYGIDVGNDTNVANVVDGYLGGRGGVGFRDAGMRGVEADCGGAG